MAEMKFEQVFDPQRCLQYVNNETSVLHCHHYATLFTHLALNMKDVDGPAKLSRSMEEAFYLILRKYFISEEIVNEAERIDTARQYCALTGMGTITLNLNRGGGTAVMNHSHVDEGWLKKWGPASGPVNFIGQGMIAAIAAAVYNQTVGSYTVRETASIAAGQSSSTFEISKRS